MKLIRVDLTGGDIRSEEIPAEYRFLGGRGFTSTLLNREVPGKSDPLGPKNKLIFAPGILSGTSLINTSRISVGAKSPLTGGIKESNVGGTISAALGRIGIPAIIIEGQVQDDALYLLRVDKDGNPELIPADDYRGMRTYAFVEQIFNKYGEKNSILCIGPAGENKMAIASIQSTDMDGHPCRAAGRGGMGAVMGSKGLKALIVEQGARSSRNQIANPKLFVEEAKFFTKAVKENPLASKTLPLYGTSIGVANINAAGAFPCYNARYGRLEEWEKIGPERFVQTMKDRGGQPTHKGCTQCIIDCSNVYVDSSGQYLTGSLEYETLWSMGGMPGITDLDTIARLDYLCDTIGVDTMSTGVALGVAMDAGYKEFGDGEAAINILHEIEKATDLGKVFGEGPVSVGKHFGNNRVPVSKRQSIAGYDPRAIQGMAVTYSTSPMGADHTAGYVIAENLAPGSTLDPLKPEGQVEASRNAQIRQAFMDCTGLCSFASSSVKKNTRAEEAVINMINAKYGLDWKHDHIRKIGLQILKEEREFNRKAGFTAEDDQLNEMFYTEPLPPHNKTILIPREDMENIFDF